MYIVYQNKNQAIEEIHDRQLYTKFTKMFSASF